MRASIHLPATEQLSPCGLRITGSRGMPWWFAPIDMSSRLDLLHHSRVDLGAEATVGEIRIWNRQDDYATRLHNLEIKVGNGDPNDQEESAQNGICTRIMQVLPGGYYVFTCANPLNGRYVSIQIFDSRPSILTLCEVQVYSASE
eukprot:350499-Chlamydomonas_euryale.AAC.15